MIVNESWEVLWLASETLGQDLWDLYEIFQEVGLPEESEQID